MSDLHEAAEKLRNQMRATGASFQALSQAAKTAAAAVDALLELAPIPGMVAEMDAATAPEHNKGPFWNEEEQRYVDPHESGVPA